MFDKLKGLASVFVDVDEDKKAPQATPTPTIVAPLPVKGAVGTAPMGGSFNPAPPFDQAMMDTLQKVILARKTAYTGLLESAARLESIIPDPNTRVKAAFASGEGRTVQDVTRAIDVHISDLDNERIRFGRSSEAQLVSKRNTPLAQAQDNRTKAEQCTQEIQSLEARIEQLRANHASLLEQAQEAETAASNAEAEIQQVQTKFDTTVEYLKNELVTRKTQLSTILL